MMKSMATRKVPTESYGVLTRNVTSTSLDLCVEELSIKGFTILNGGYSSEVIDEIKESSVTAKKKYIQRYGSYELDEIGESNTVRSPSNFIGRGVFTELFENDRLITTLKNYIQNQVLLLQQNIIFNPPKQSYGAGRWHRDLPYQHFISSKPLAVNALFAVDDFTANNGATWVLPGSHKTENFPSEDYIIKNAEQIFVPAGNFLVLDAMLFHCGGDNQTNSARVGINHVFGIPYFAQQIRISDVASSSELAKPSAHGYETITSFLSSRRKTN